ncbi:MAG: AbrB/MazE/SpoVT family DNA-binding domain-containing protein [Candidatus Aenigmatarchaeota archaeon]|nr:AbrB/MazE/SpoVT family DNA-binding domain-containing protein [Candidatus Aenigmarchaeota archaeon]
MNRRNRNVLCCGSTKVGSRGQIVIPQEVREKFNIKTGDLLLVVENGSHIKLLKQDILTKIVEKLGD